MKWRLSINVWLSLRHWCKEVGRIAWFCVDSESWIRCKNGHRERNTTWLLEIVKEHNMDEAVRKALYVFQKKSIYFVPWRYQEFGKKKRKMLQLQLEIYANLNCLGGRNWTRWPEKRALPMSPSMGDWEYPRISKSVKTWDFSLNINGEAAWSTVKSSPHLFHCSFYLQSLFVLMCISKPFCGLKYLQKIWLLFSL